MSVTSKVEVSHERTRVGLPVTVGTLVGGSVCLRITRKPSTVHCRKTLLVMRSQ